MNNSMFEFINKNIEPIKEEKKRQSMPLSEGSVDNIMNNIQEEGNLAIAREALEKSGLEAHEIENIMDDIFDEENLGIIRDALESALEEKKKKQNKCVKDSKLKESIDEITVADKLLADGYITQEERDELKTKDGEVVDNSNCSWEILENGDVLIHSRGAYPLKLEGYVKGIDESKLKESWERPNIKKNEGKTITSSYYKWGKFVEKTEIDHSEFSDMELLSSEDLLGFEIRPEDKGKNFYAYSVDIDRDDTGNEGVGVKHSYAVNKVVMGESKVNEKMIMMPKEVSSKIPKLYSQEKKKPEEVQIAVKFFDPTGSWTWYATEGEPTGETIESGAFKGQPDWTFFGYVKGFEGELGYFTLGELSVAKEGAKGLQSLPIERDRHFSGTLADVMNESTKESNGRQSMDDSIHCQCGRKLTERDANCPSCGKALAFIFRDIALAEARKNDINEVKMDVDGKEYTVLLVDDGTLDTVISINGKEYRFDSEYAERFRDENGAMTENGLMELANEVFETEDPDMIGEAKDSEDSKVGELITQGSNSGGDDELEWEDLTYELTQYMKKVNPSGLWTASVKNFGWRGSDGQRDEFRADDGETLLFEILPQTECSFKIYAYGEDGIAINNAHHDSPVWKEWYYVVPSKGEDVEGSEMKYQCGSCEREFNKLEDGSCPYCGSGNWVEGNIDDVEESKVNEMHSIVAKLRATYKMSEEEAVDLAKRLQRHGICVDKLIGASDPKTGVVPKISDIDSKRIGESVDEIEEEIITPIEVKESKVKEARGDVFKGDADVTVDGQDYYVEFEVDYEVSQGYPQTHDSPAEPGGIDINDVRILKIEQYVSEDVNYRDDLPPRKSPALRKPPKMVELKWEDLSDKIQEDIEDEIFKTAEAQIEQNLSDMPDEDPNAPDRWDESLKEKVKKIIEENEQEEFEFAKSTPKKETPKEDDQNAKLNKLVDETVPEFKPIVDGIEKGIKTTKDNYGRYMSVLTQFEKGRMRQFVALVLIKAGANPSGVRSAMQALGESKKVKESVNEERRRDYTKVGAEDYSKEEIDSAIQTVEWEDFRKDNLPFSQGEALKKIVTEFKIPLSKINKMSLHGVIKGTHGFYGLDVDYKNANVHLYIADDGVSVRVVAADVEEKKVEEAIKEGKVFTLDGTRDGVDYEQDGDKVWLRWKGEREEIRNQCWNCGKYWDLSKPLDHEEGQKHYYECNHCGSVNHL
jgi:hypothetical protein